MFGIPNSLALGRSLYYKSKLSGFISTLAYIGILVVALMEII
jgi:hypothetical protein